MSRCQVVEGLACFPKGHELFPEATEGFRQGVTQCMYISGQPHQRNYEDELAQWCHFNSRSRTPSIPCSSLTVDLGLKFSKHLLLQPGGLESDSRKSGTFWVVRMKTEKSFPTKSKAKMFFWFHRAQC